MKAPAIPVVFAGLDERTQDAFNAPLGETTAYADMRALLRLALEHVDRAEATGRGVALCCVVIRGTNDEARRPTAIGEAMYRKTEGFEGELMGEKTTEQIRMMLPKK